MRQLEGRYAQALNVAAMSSPKSTDWLAVVLQPWYAQPSRLSTLGQRKSWRLRKVGIEQNGRVIRRHQQSRNNQK